jgi:hypothetical protein
MAADMMRVRSSSYLVRTATGERTAGCAYKQNDEHDQQRSQTTASGRHLDPFLDAAPTDRSFGSSASSLEAP